VSVGYNKLFHERYVQSNCGMTSLKGYFVSLYRKVVITEECHDMVNSEELTGTTEYLTV
jgi:hypothetical protein